VMQHNIDTRFAADAGALPDVRRCLDDLADRLPPDELEELRLVANELATNSIRHAGLGAEDQVGLRVSVTPEVVHGEVCDSGPGFEAPAPPPKPESSSGWGLYIVERVVDRWGLDRNGCFCVWFEIDLPPRSKVSWDTHWSA
jgi:anti-sigma regulatory factor (Ser/Thr protein kinase)